MNCYSPKEIADVSIQKGTEKANLSKLNVMLLGFLGGAFIALGYLAFIRHWNDAKRMGRISYLNRCIGIPNWTYMYITRRWRITYREYDGC